MRLRPSPRVWPVVLAVLLTAWGGLAGGVVATLGGPAWELERTLSYSAASSDPLLADGVPSDTYLERTLQNAAVLAQSERVLTPAAEALDLDDGWPELSEAVSVTPESGTDALQVVVTAEAPERALEQLDAVTASFEQVARQQVVERATAVAEAARATAQESPDDGRLQELVARAEVIARTAEPVTVLTTELPVQTGPNLVRDVATGAVLGLLLAAGVLVLARVAGGSVRTGRDVREVLALPAAELRSGELDDQGERLVHDLLRVAAADPRRRVLVVPAGPSSVVVADDLADTVERHRDCLQQHHGVADVRVSVSADPSSTVLSGDARDASVVALAVAAGASAREVRTYQRMSQHWDRPLVAAFLRP